MSASARGAKTSPSGRAGRSVQRCADATMAVVRLEGPNDSRALDYSAVPDRTLLRSRGLFVAEGRLIVERLLASRRFRVRSLLLNEASYRSLQPALSALSPETPIYLCDTPDFQQLAGFPLHRGCLALAERPAIPAFEDLLVRSRLVVVLEGVTNADNVGGVFRNASAFGVDAVLLSPTTCDPLYRKAVRTSMAATLQVPFARIEIWPDDLRMLKARGFTVVALTPRGNSETIDAFAAGDQPERVALLVGSEGAGLSDGADAAADRRVRIPISSRVDSLNLALAAGIAMSRLSRHGPL